MRPRSILALGLLALFGCDEPADAEPIVAEPVVTEAAPTAPAATAPPITTGPPPPYRVRFVRPCPEWSSADLLTTDELVFACDGVVFDADDGALVHVRPSDDDHQRFAVATAGRFSLWDAMEPGRIVLRGPDLRERVVSIAGVQRAVAAAPDGRRALVATSEGLAEIELETARARPVDGSERCANASAVGYDAQGRPQCIVHAGERNRLRTVGVERDVELASLRYARWHPNGGRVLILFTEGTARWIEGDGRIVAWREARDARLLAMSDRGEALVTLDGRTERWTLTGESIEAEAVFPRAPREAGFVGDQIVLLLGSDTLVWLHRGEARALPSLGQIPAPESFERLRESQDGDARSFTSARGDTFPRGGNDEAAFLQRAGGYKYLRVGRTDAGELRRFEGDDAEWARVVAARFVVRGSQRWARSWRDAEGRRALRGHAYIGGCERTHVDVLVRERGAVIEYRVAHTGAEGEARDEALRAALGEIPDDATPVPGVSEGGYPGDPSIGRL